MRHVQTGHDDTLAALPVDLREMVMRRQTTLAKAQAWARLRAAFNGDIVALRTTLEAAYGVTA